MTDTELSKKPQVRVLTGHDIFKNVDGGRSSYGAMVMNALTGMTTEQLREKAKKGLAQSDYAAFEKAIAENGEVDAALLDAEDQFFLDYIQTKGHAALLAPPITPERLQRLVVENNALEPCIAAMVTNVACTGYYIGHVETTEAELEDGQKETRKDIEAFLSEVYPKMSFLTLRKQLKRDKYETGNSYMVVEKTLTGDVAFLRRAPSKSMRMVKLDEPRQTTLTVRRGGRDIEIKTTKAWRRYAQKIGTKLIYYKEFGCPVALNRETGEWEREGAREGQGIPPAKRAHEILHEKDLEDVRTPYGLPRWITQLPSVIGARMAEEHNLAFFQAGGVPPVMIFISGSSITAETQDALNQFLSGGSAQKQRGVAFEIPSAGDIDGSERPASVQVERFGSQNEADSTFEEYLDKNEGRIRSAFRLPGLFLGMADAYNFATAHASYVIAEAQVFKPERDEDDELFNMTVMRLIDETGEWKIKSNPLTVQDVNLQLQALTMLRDMPGLGLDDYVTAIGDAANIELSVAEGYDKLVFDGKGGVEKADDIDADGNRLSDEDDEEDETVPTPPPGTQPPPPPAEGDQAGAPPDNAPTPGVTSTVQNRKANIMAARIARAIRDFEADEDLQVLEALVACKADYDALDAGSKELVEKYLAPLVFTSPFLSEATMGDLSVAYAASIFREAEAKLKKETV